MQNLTKVPKTILNKPTFSTQSQRFRLFLPLCELSIYVRMTFSALSSFFPKYRLSTTSSRPLSCCDKRCAYAGHVQADQVLKRGKSGASSRASTSLRMQLVLRLDPRVILSHFYAAITSSNSPWFLIFLFPGFSFAHFPRRGCYGRKSSGTLVFGIFF